MTSSEEREKDLERRERELRQKETEIRLRELESEIIHKDANFHQTYKPKTEEPQGKLWKKQAILGLKLFGLGVAVFAAVKLASVVAGFVIVGTLGFITYKFFFESRIKNKK
ncbi:MAG: hypothetical protein AAF378_08695 [Cyanobacteria bacterium P01_A01_bin.84]